MAKPKNTEERSRIEKKAFQLLTMKGVTNTSFSDIADRSKVTRSLVQHYFPKKDIFIEDFITLCLTEISEIVENCEYIDISNPLERLCTVGYIQFRFLLYNNQMENLKQDILRSRDYTMLIINDVIRWTMSYLEDEDNEFKDSVADAIIFAMGGAFEYIYAGLESDTEIDSHIVSSKVISIMNALLDRSDNIASIPNKIPDEWITQKVEELNKSILG